MKLTPLFLAIVLTTPALFAQQPTPQPPLVTTSGSALIRVAPDLADLSFEVEVRNIDLAVARKQQAERATKLLAALRAAGIAESELQSSQVQLTADYTDRRQETEKIKFYRVSQSICCTLRDVAKVPDVTAAAVAAGATGVGYANLRTSQLRKHRDEARSKAIQAAREKAVAFATDLGAKAGKPYTITEDAHPGYRSTNFNSIANNIQAVAEAAPGGDETTSAFAPGTISITASVTVAFLLE
jgi:uncharacterized protein